MFLIGLTGGIGAGKSTIARRLAELGATVLDADQVARDAVAPGTPALKELVAAFGSNILSPDGTLNREQLAKQVFGSPDELQRLNAIVHPAVRALTAERLNELRISQPSGVVVYDVPLLIEASVDHHWDLIVIAMADEETRVQRLTAGRGMSEKEARRRIAHQATDEQRRAIADVIIDTNGSLQHTLEQTDTLWETVRERASRDT